MTLDPNMPILVAASQLTDKAKPEDGLSPHAMLQHVAEEAIAGTGQGAAVKAALDAISTVQMTVDAPQVQSMLSGKYPNLPRTLARALGKDSVPVEISSATGGNSPQMLVNDMAERIANGEARVAVLAGCETLDTMIKRLKSGISIEDWTDDPGGKPIKIGSDAVGQSDYEAAHQVNFPVNIYPMFENALRGHYGLTLEQHFKKMGELAAPFTKVAAANPHSWFPVERTPEELVTVTEDNRWVGYPYPKYLNSIIRVNMGAAVVMCSVSAAEEMGIDRSKWVFLHGCGDAYDHWNVIERDNFHSSPAIHTIAKTGFDMAGWGVDDLDFIDLYSCFTSAVQIGADEIGLAHDDPRGLTITGGLPYFGGPGNSYVMNSIAEMVSKLQGAKPGSKGLVTANGYYVTKHSMGLYSTAPKEGKWERKPQAEDQAIVDAGPKPKVTVEANGNATIETYTVVHGRQAPDFAIIMGRLGDGSRFVANTPKEQAIFNSLMEKDSLGRTGTVSHAAGLNSFIPDGV